MDLPLPYISYKWNRILCDLLWMASFTKHHVFKVHPCGSSFQYFISFYDWTIFHCMDITTFVYQLIDILVVITFGLLNDAINVCVPVSVQTCFRVSHVCIYLGVESLGHIGTLWLTLWGTAKAFSTAPAPFYIPTSNVQGFQFHILPQHIFSIFVFIITILMHVRWYLIVVLICMSLMTNDVFMCNHLYTFFGELSIQILCPFFTWVFCRFIVEL